MHIICIYIQYISYICKDNSHIYAENLHIYAKIFYFNIFLQKLRQHRMKLKNKINAKWNQIYYIYIFYYIWWSLLLLFSKRKSVTGKYGFVPWKYTLSTSHDTSGAYFSISKLCGDNWNNSEVISCNGIRPLFKTRLTSLTRKRALHARMSHSTVCNTTVSTKKTRLTLVK